MTDQSTAIPPRLDLRNFSGWIIVFLLCALTVFSELAPKKETKTKEADLLAHHQAQLRIAVGMASKSSSKLLVKSLSEEPSPTDSLKKIRREVAPLRGTSPVASQLYAATSVELGKVLVPSDLAGLHHGSPFDRLIEKAYLAPSLTVAEAKRLTQGVEERRGYLGKLTQAQILSKAGVKDARRGLSTTWALMLIAGISVAIFSGSILAWIAYFLARSNGWKPLGLAFNPPHILTADRAAIRAAQLMTLFTIGELVVMTICSLLGFNQGVTFFVFGVSMILGVVGLFRTPVLAQSLRLSDIGITTDRLPYHLLLGAAAFLIELPLTLTAARIGSAIFPNNEATHPASTLISNNHNPVILAGTFFFAAVIAPFWEEIMFRGLLFPALSRVLKGQPFGMVISAVATSLVFASLHPQGISLWFALATVAMASCTVSYYTKSLVPSIVMHSLHNGTIVILGVLMS